MKKLSEDESAKLLAEVKQLVAELGELGEKIDGRLAWLTDKKAVLLYVKEAKKVTVK